jgi:Zn-dependent protease with chaperone function
MVKINKNLALFFALFIVAGTILLITLQRLSPLIGHVTYYCQSLLVEANMIPIPYYLTIVPFLLLAFILTISFIKFFILNIKAQFLKLKLKGDAVREHDINELVQRLGLEKQAILVKSNKPFAFCLGIRTPKIYFSTGLLSTLSVQEVEAVLRHEQYHLENHDTFTMIVASVVNSLFPYFPLIGDFINRYRIEREIEADKFAVHQIGNQIPLISALKKLLAFPTTGSIAIAAIADQDTFESRICSLINKPLIQRRFRIRNLLITLFSSLILTSFIIMPVYAKEIHHEEHDVMMLCTEGECMNSCTSKENLTKLYSEMPRITNGEALSSHE